MYIHIYIYIYIERERDARGRAHRLTSSDMKPLAEAKAMLPMTSLGEEPTLPFGRYLCETQRGTVSSNPRCTTVLSVSVNKNTPREKDPCGNINFDDSKSGAREQFLSPETPRETTHRREGGDGTARHSGSLVAWIATSARAHAVV